MAANDSTNRLAGIARFTVEGVSYLLAGDLEYSVASVARETLTGMDSVHGYKEMPKAPYISGTLRDTGQLTIADFNAMTNVNISLALANGKTIIGSKMWCISELTQKPTDGTFEVKFEGIDGSVTER